MTLGVGSSVAQLFPGRITGTVRDAQGAVIPGATVKLSNPTTGLERTVTTDDTGNFNFAELAIGTFRLTITKHGFGPSVVTDITTSQGVVNAIKPVLAVGSVSSRIEVVSMPPLVQTETNSTGGQLSDVQVEALPIGNSDYTRLALVLPGVTQNSNFAFAQYTINGSRSRSNGFNVDGACDTDPSTYLPSINEGGNSATVATRLPLDAIEEVSVSANAGADSGTVQDAIPGMPAYQRGIRPYTRILAVNGRQFSIEELNQALAESKTQTGTIGLLVSNAGFIESHEIDYHGGLRYPHLVRNNEARDYLDEILKPRTTQ